MSIDRLQMAKDCLNAYYEAGLAALFLLLLRFLVILGDV